MLALLALQAYPIFFGPGKVRTHVLRTGKTATAMILGYETDSDGFVSVVYEFTPENAASSITCKRLAVRRLEKLLPVGQRVEVRYLKSAPTMSILVPYAELQTLP
jgi:hypothetical protein